MKTILVDGADTFTVDGKINEDMYKLLERYKNTKIIVSNADDSELEEYGLVNMPYELYSLKHNPNKTNPKYFSYLMTYYKLKPADVIYFEHNPEAVKSAESHGIASYHYDSKKRDLRALEKFIDSNI